MSSGLAFMSPTYWLNVSVGSVQVFKLLRTAAGIFRYVVDNCLPLLTTASPAPPLHSADCVPQVGIELGSILELKQRGLHHVCDVQCSTQV